MGEGKLNYEMRLPGYGGAGFFLRRTVAGDPPSSSALDIWLLGPDFCTATLGRATAPDFLPRIARYFFDVASSAAPEKQLPAFADGLSGVSVDVGASDQERVGLRIGLIIDLDDDLADPEMLDFETSRAAVAHTAHRIADLVGGVQLADFEELN